MGRTRKEAAAATREALIDAAIAAFAEEGLDASLDSVCRRAGYTRGAFYVHFRTREDLLAAVTARTTGSFVDAMVATDGGLAGIVSRFAGAVLGGTFPIGGRGRVRSHHVLDACARSPDVRRRYVEVHREVVARLADAVRAGQTDGSVRADVDADGVARLLLAVVLGVQTMLETGVGVEPAAMAGAVTRMLAPTAD